MSPHGDNIHVNYNMKEASRSTIKVVKEATGHASYNMNNIDISTVLHVDSVRGTVKVKNMKHGTTIVGMPQHLGEFTLPPNTPFENWSAVVNYNTKPPYIISFINDSSLTFGHEDQVANSASSKGQSQDVFESIFTDTKMYRSHKEKSRNLNYRANKPFDRIAGDIGWQGYDGNLMGILRGGVNISKVSDLCQTLQILAENLTRTISENYELMTSWGIVSIKNVNDSVKLQVKAADSVNDKVRQGIYDLSLEVGDTTDNKFISFKYQPPNSDVVIFTLDRKGRIFKYTGTDEVSVVGEDKVLSVGQKHFESAQEHRKIDSKKVDVTASGGAASLQLGADDCAATNDTFVKYPHLLQYQDLLNFTLSLYNFLVITIVPQLPQFLPLTLPPYSTDAASLNAQNSSLLNTPNRTDITVGK